MPSVLALPLSLVTTPVFDETVRLFVFAGMLTFVSTAPSRGGLPALVLLLLVLALFALSVVAQPVRAAATARTIASARLRRIDVSPSVRGELFCGRPFPVVYCYR